MGNVCSSIVQNENLKLKFIMSVLYFLKNIYKINIIKLRYL